MKYSVAGIALLASLFLYQGCSSTTKTEDTSDNQQSQVQSVPQQTYQSKQPSANPQNSNKISSTKNSQATKGKLTIPEKITPNQPVAIKVEIPATVAKANSTNSNSNSNDASQPKQINMVVVSNDLRFFDLVQASYKNNQNIEVKPKFPAPGDYTVFSDYNPSGEKEQISVEKVSIPGEVPFPTELESFSKTKTLSDTKIDLNLSQPNIKAGKKVTLKFDIKQASNNKPVQDLKTYLGQKANLVVIKSSSPLVESDYINIENVNNSSNNQVNFTTKFPQPGTYKLWLQFNRNGQVKTADFWVTVNS